MPSNSSLLRTFLDVGKSPIHGTGLFAKKDIKNGTLLGEFTGRVVQNPRGLEGRVEDAYVVAMKKSRITGAGGGELL